MHSAARKSASNATGVQLLHVCWGGGRLTDLGCDVAVMLSRHCCVGKSFLDLFRNVEEHCSGNRLTESSLSLNFDIQIEEL